MLNIFPSRIQGFLKKRYSNEMTMETIIMVVIGMYIFKLGLSIIISPGRRPIGNLPSQGQKSPTARNTTPNPINTFCITPWTIPAANLSPYSHQPVSQNVS
jgi:hypothetical protein